MLKKFFAAMLAIIASTTLFADITLETAALPGAQLIITADSALLKDSLFMNYMEKAREAQKELVGEYGELYKKFEMMLPPGAKNNDKSLIAIASSKLNGTMDEIVANYIGDEKGEHPYESPEGLTRGNGTLTMATNVAFLSIL